MMKFTEQEKVAILKAMDILIKADNEIDEREVGYLEVIVEEFGWDRGFLSKLENYKKSEALEAVKGMSNEKLNYFQTILIELAQSDDNLHPMEKRFLNQVEEFILDNV